MKEYKFVLHLYGSGKSPDDAWEQLVKDIQNGDAFLDLNEMSYDAAVPIIAEQEPSQIAQLVHEDGGIELWFEGTTGNVIVHYNIPENSDSKGTHIMSPLQALRQYTLMTSAEGWENVGYEQEWHDYIKFFVDRETYDLVK